jgi:hypothetical protein
MSPEPSCRSDDSSHRIAPKCGTFRHFGDSLIALAADAIALSIEPVGIRRDHLRGACDNP